VGVSNFRPWDMRLLQSAMTNRLVTNQIELSLGSHDALVNGDVAHLMEVKAPPMAWSPLAGGRLLAAAPEPLRHLLARLADQAGTDWSAVAVAWLLHHPARILPVIGTNDPARIAKISDALRVPMDRQTWFELYSAALGREVA
jgi:predicted oxidoreductase